MSDKKKVYVETSVISYLTARPSHDLIKNARQLATQDWWQIAPIQFDLHISSLVEREAAKGDADAAPTAYKHNKGDPWFAYYRGDFCIGRKVARGYCGSSNKF